jgi:hypothetical protein
LLSTLCSRRSILNGWFARMANIAVRRHMGKPTR